MPPTGRKKDPFAGFRYRVIFDGYEQVGFSEITGLRDETAVTEYREGDDEPTNRKIPGRTTYDPLSLKRGVDPSNVLRRIRNSVVQSDGPNFGDGLADPDFRISGSILLLDKGRSIVKRWRIKNAWSNIWGVDGLNALSDDIAMEEIGIVHEGVQEVSSGTPVRV